MAEEVKNASTIVPWCMITTILLNGMLGFAIVITFCFCLGDLPTDMASPTGYDFIQVFYGATNSIAATSVMTAILIILVICATFGFLASASRQTWAFARDRGLPMSSFLSYVRLFLVTQASQWPNFLRHRSINPWLSP
jgi:choline transport protein